MYISNNDIDAIWSIFLNKISPKLTSNLTPIKNLLGSSEHHKKLFKEAVQEYSQTNINFIYLKGGIHIKNNSNAVQIKPENCPHEIDPISNKCIICGIFGENWHDEIDCDNNKYSK